MLLRQRAGRERRVAFTLMEMLIVVAIIVALAGIGGFFLIGALQGGQKGIAEAQVRGPLTDACRAYYTKHNQWPDSLQQLTQKDDHNMIYLETVDALYDPWSSPAQPRPYQYDKTGQKNNGMKPDIWTVSPDGIMIGNWSKNMQQQN